MPVLARKGELRALVAVANPSDVGAFIAGPVPLAPIAVEAEVQRATDSFLGLRIDVDVLGGEGRRPATRRNILEALRKEIQVLYLVCHGRIHENRPEILLEDDEGDADIADGAAFASDVGALDTVPTVVILCSCQSAGRGDAYPRRRTSQRRHRRTADGGDGRGPVGARAGACPGRRHGRRGHAGRRHDEDDRPLPAAFPDRAQPRRHPGPRDGRRPAVGPGQAGLVHAGPVLPAQARQRLVPAPVRGPGGPLFRNLRTRIGAKHCTAVVGAGIAGEDAILPSRQELAVEWVRRRQIPMAETSQTDLASVAQFVRVEQESGPSLVQDELFFLLRNELRRMHGSKLPELGWASLPIATLVSLIAEHRRAGSGGTDGYSRLARLDLPVFVTTSWTNLLEDALEEQGKRPYTRYFDWRKSTSPDLWPYLYEGETGDGSSAQAFDDVTGP